MVANCVSSFCSSEAAAISPPALAKRFSLSKTQSEPWYCQVPARSVSEGVEVPLMSSPSRSPRPWAMAVVVPVPAELFAVGAVAF